MAEKIITAFFLAVSIVYLYFAKQLTFGTLQSPRSGFLPMLAGMIAVIVALLLLWRQLRSKKTNALHPVDWTKFIFILIGVLFYITVFNIIGYFAATFIFLFYLFKIADTAGWLLPFILAASSSSIFYLVFKYYLAVTLP